MHVFRGMKQMAIRDTGIVLFIGSLVHLSGCVGGVFSAGGDSTVSVVAAKATAVAEAVGGENGFGGPLMTGYADHMPLHVGFSSGDDLAAPGEVMSVTLRNDSQVDGTFHLYYFAGHMGFSDQTMDVDVAAGEEVAVEIPCAEIIGVGSLNQPGAIGCHLADGDEVDNRISVPGFLGQDFACNDVYEFALTPDVDDLDNDGDTQELVIVSDAMEYHMEDGGPFGHAHGMGPGMMGTHMGF